MQKKASNIIFFDPSSNGRALARDKTVYHYTSPDALRNILLTPSIRFTDCQFLNDRTEYIHILELFGKVNEKIGKKLNDPELIKWIAAQVDSTYQAVCLGFWYDHDGKTHFGTLQSRYFVFCTSEHKDSLNMWNYYLKDGSYRGYNIGLSLNAIVDQIPQTIVDRIMFGRIIYKDSDKISLLSSLVLAADQKLSALSKEAMSADRLHTLESEVFLELNENIQKFRMFFKHEAFEDEKECRIVIVLPLKNRNQSDKSLTKCFTSNHGLFTPHYDLIINQDCVKCVRLSPMMDVPLAKAGMKLLLEENFNSTKIKIEESSIPVRF